MLDLVSVIMPAYNAEKYIAESIESVIAQTYTNWELIVVDDGSTDGTARIVLEYVTLYSRIKYIYQENQKQGAARNNGLKHSRGKFIAFLDSDDLWVTNKIEIQLKCIEEKKSDMVFSDGFVFTKDIQYPDYEYNTFKGEVAGDEGFKRMLDHNFIPILSVLVTRQSLNEVGGFDPNPEIQNVEDYQLWLRLLLKGFKIWGMPDKLFYYRQHIGQVTASDPYAFEKVLLMLNTFSKYPLLLQSDIRKAMFNQGKTWYLSQGKTRTIASIILIKIAQIEQLKLFAMSIRIVLILLGLRASRKVISIWV